MTYPTIEEVKEYDLKGKIAYLDWLKEIYADTAKLSDDDFKNEDVETMSIEQDGSYIKYIYNNNKQIKWMEIKKAKWTSIHGINSDIVNNIDVVFEWKIWKEEGIKYILTE